RTALRAMVSKDGHAHPWLSAWRQRMVYTMYAACPARAMSSSTATFGVRNHGVPSQALCGPRVPGILAEVGTPLPPALPAGDVFITMTSPLRFLPGAGQQPDARHFFLPRSG